MTIHVDEMLVPIRCFTCGKVLADKWRYYERRVKEANDNPPQPRSATDIPDRTHEGRVLDELGVTKICCRRHFLTTVDMMDSI